MKAMDTFPHNRRILDRRWPGLWKRLQAAPSPRSIALSGGTPEQTLLIDGIQLSSAYHRRAEAARQATLIPVASSTAHLYGFALGDLARQLLTRRALHVLHVWIVSPATAYHSLLYFDHHDWLSDPRTRLGRVTEDSTLQRPFAASPACLRLAADHAVRIRDLVELELTKPYHQQHMDSLAGLFQSRLAENLRFCEADGDVRQLAGSRVGKRAAIAAGGPTLAEQYEWLHTHRTEIVLIAVSTALVPLQRAGIVPDVVVVIDHEPSQATHFSMADLPAFRETPLVYVPTVHEALLSQWPGPRLTAYLRTPHFAELREQIPKGSLFCSGTVTHSAVDLAVQMGCHEIVLLGADFCYPQQRSHVDGAVFAAEIPVDSRAHHWVLNGHDDRVPSEINLCGYLRDLETYITGHPEVRFLKRGRDGAQVAGAVWLDEA